MTALLDPVVLGDDLVLPNRICMSSMTRNRCLDDSKPDLTVAEYYAQRASAGLIIAEGTFVHTHGTEFPYAPIMSNRCHARAWEKVVEAVHAAGGRIYLQLWHAGRIQNEGMPLLRESGYPVLAPSAAPAAGGDYRLLSGRPGHSHTTEILDIEGVVARFRNAAMLAKEAGLDGIELLSQGGYLLHSFLCSHANVRQDQYGGSIENRCRFPLQVLDAIIDIWGHRRIGIRICPVDILNDSATTYEEARSTYDYYIKELMRRELGYITLSRRGCDLGRDAAHQYVDLGPRSKGKELPPLYEPLQDFGHLIKKPGSKTLLMVNHEYMVAEGEDLLKKELVDIVSYWRPFIFNPDVVDRVRNNVPFAVNDRGGWVYYGPCQHPSEGYTDWPEYTAEAAV